MNILHKILTNGFLLLVPILVWNLLFAAKLPLAEYSSDENLSRWLLLVEMVLRIAVFAFPLLLTMRLATPINKVGLLLYVVGSLLYFGAWIVEIYWPGSTVASRSVVILAPYYTPLIFMAGIGLMGNSLLYILLAAVFTIFHTYHGLVSFGYLTTSG